MPVPLFDKFIDGSSYVVFPVFKAGATFLFHVFKIRLSLDKKVSIISFDSTGSGLIHDASIAFYKVYVTACQHR